ncbi:MAG: hypothetical protein ACTHJY_08205 [Rhizobiaceae bacterium]
MQWKVSFSEDRTRSISTIEYNRLLLRDKLPLCEIIPGYASGGASHDAAACAKFERAPARNIARANFGPAGIGHRQYRPVVFPAIDVSAGVEAANLDRNSKVAAIVYVDRPGVPVTPANLDALIDAWRRIRLIFLPKVNRATK